MVPVYVGLRKQGDAIGLAIASSAAIMVYVMVLGWLQRRRFEREAAARGATLGKTRACFKPRLRPGVAALVATGVGLLVRARLLQWLPGEHIATMSCRAALLCMIGLGVYAWIARLLRVDEIIRSPLAAATSTAQRRGLLTMTEDAFGIRFIRDPAPRAGIGRAARSSAELGHRTAACFRP